MPKFKDETIVLSRPKIIARIKKCRDEADKLQMVLDSLDSFDSWAELSANSGGVGRPKKNNPFTEKLRAFVREQSAGFDRDKIKAALGEVARKDQIADAIQTLESEGVLRVVDKPIGRGKGLYENLQVKQTKPGE